MLTPALKTLSEIATAAHTRIQNDFPNINPVVGVSHGMRASGIPADVMTIDCLATQKRIILILHDDQPDCLRYQFGFRDKHPNDAFKEMQRGELSAQMLYDWIANYFS